MFSAGIRWVPNPVQDSAPTPHLNPRGGPTCQLHALTHGIPRRTKQAGRPAPPPQRSHIPTNAVHSLLMPLSVPTPKALHVHVMKMRREVSGDGEGRTEGAKCFPREPALWLTPIGTSVCRVPTKEGGLGSSTGPKARDNHRAPRTNRKPGPTTPASPRPAQTLKPRFPALTPSPPPEEATNLQRRGASRKGAATTKSAAPLQKKQKTDQPTQRNKNTPHKGGLMTNMPDIPQGRANRAPSTRCCPARHRTAATTRPMGQRNTTHTNTEAAYKPHPAQNNRPTQMRTPSQHRHMHPSIDKQTTSGSRADPATHHPTHHRAQGKDTSPASRRAPQKGHSPYSKEAARNQNLNQKHPDPNDAYPHPSQPPTQTFEQLS
ncbi:hypothetical protein CRENBAI_002929 [Crenichthys baileyi]|uniref:Uncharacterized protein n=1 Tax=Crenichthys baileyi TaxID=28760 RepID=A0AAV9RNT1_9TELE